MRVAWIPAAWVVALAACGASSHPSSAGGPDAGAPDAGDVDAGPPDGPPDGGGGVGSMVLPGVGAVSFAAAALPSGSAVALEKGTGVAALAAFDEGANDVGARDRTGYYLRVTTGTAQPSGPATVELELPPELQVSSSLEPRLFARFYTANDDEALDDFIVLDAMPGSSPATIAATLPPSAFTDARTGDGTMEAQVLIATVPPQPMATARLAAAAAGGGRFCENPNAMCSVSCMHTPLLRTLRGKRGLNLTSTEAALRHKGFDFRAETGTTAVAVAAGTVVESRFSRNIPEDCNYPMDCPGKGFGETILLDVPGVGLVRYMHLEAGSRTIPDCCTGPDGKSCRAAPDLEACTAAVGVGTVLGLTDNTGYSQAPHLHFEVTSGGKVVDPGPCILPPEYHGDFEVHWKRMDANGTFDLVVTAKVKFKWSEAVHDYQAEGNWKVDMTSTDPECVATIVNDTGAINADDASIHLGGFKSELLHGSYLMGSAGSIPPLPYAAAGLTMAPVIAKYDCVVPGGGHVMGQFIEHQVIWWPSLFTSPSWPVYARPNPYDASAPFEDLVESDVPDFPAPLTTATSSYTVTARDLPGAQ